jgi:Ubiquitin-conjugating enzyme
MSAEQFAAMEQKVLAGNFMSEDTYGEILAEWVVSSVPFANQTGAASSFLHYYNATIRKHGTFASGKTLVHEARRCHKTLPVPHSNAASFVCYAEERMDLCRAVITGPVDTPYAFGIFVFDIYYPMNYPQIPPLVNFMTTGAWRNFLPVKP